MKSPWVRFVVILFATVISVALIGAGVLAYLVSRVDVRAEIERAVESGTGRDLTIRGPVGVSFWPVLGLRAQDASLANVAGGRAPAFASIGEIHVGVEIRPLFDRQVVVRQLVLQRPVIALEIDRQGRPNWILRPAAPPPGTAPPPRPQQPSNPSTQVRQFSLREVRISDGEISMFDARRGTGWSVGDVNIKTALTALNEPMKIEGDIRYADQKVTLDLEIGEPGAAIAGRLTTLKAEITSDLVNATFDGRTTAASGEIAGAINATGPSLRRLSGWAGSPIPEGANLEAFQVSGNVAIGGGLFSFTNAGFQVDLVRGRGDFELSQLRGKPYLSGRLELFDFDLNPYLSGQAAPTAEAAGPPPVQGAPSAEIAAVETPARALDVQAAPNETPINLAGLRAINCDLELVTAAVLIQHMRWERSRLNLVINDGYLAATLHNITLYNGSGRGRFEIDARAPSVRIVEDMIFEGVDTQRFLNDAVNFSNIEGRGEVSINLVMQGTTPSQLVNAADGRIHVEVVSGKLHGVDLGGVARTIRNALRGELIAPEAVTPFTGFSATFDMADGVLASDDLSFNTPDLRIPGLAVIDLPQRRLDLRMAPRAQRQVFVYPFAARGPFDHLAYESDLRDRALREITARVREVKAASRAARAQ
ncbi:AsmA family protein [Terricaulis sp.]|uniref:AsmA family protein n=1 Tax=Terricaulis sp. TaxID=2768686 RepID=UPI00378330CD